MIEHPLLLIGALVAIGLVYVVLPSAVMGWGRARHRETVFCPQARERAGIRIRPLSAAAREVWPTLPLRVDDCSLWPDRRFCHQDCVRSAGV